MRSTKVMSATVLLLLFGMSETASARQEKPKEESRPPKQEQQAKPEKPQQSQAPKQPQEHQQQHAQAPKRQQASPEKQQQAQAPKQQNNSGKQQQQANASRPQNNSASQQQHANGQRSPESNSEKQQARTPQQQPRLQQARSSKPPQRTQQAVARQRSQPALRLSVRGSARIPDDRFRSHFGREHSFRIGTPVLVGGYSRFQYGGFWFGFVEPWPQGWYYTDDVYIDYVDGGYYMYNPYYPGARYSISVVI
jgi:hypothetical protein